MSPNTRTPHIQKPQPTSAYLFNGFAHAASAVALICFLVTLGQTIICSVLQSSPEKTSGWPVAFLTIATGIATLTSISRQLAGQNVMLAATIIASIGGIIHAIGVITGIPFGPFAYSSNAGPKFFGTLSWAIPVLWIIVLLNARGVARLILKPWRKTKNYGFWVIGVATILVALFDLALEPFATHINGYWVWTPTKFPWTWNGVPWINSIGWMITSLLALAFATPSLINKHSRSRKLPPEFHPLYVWLLLLTLFGVAAGLQDKWSVVTLCSATGVASAFFAIRGARW